MKWIKVSEQPPTEAGTYLVYAPSADPDSPLIVTVLWTPALGWHGIPSIWCKAITLYMPLKEFKEAAAAAA